jgi:hypothetical protein
VYLLGIFFRIRVGLIGAIGAIGARNQRKLALIFKLSVDLCANFYAQETNVQIIQIYIIKNYHLAMKHFVAVQQLRVAAITTHTLQAISQFIALVDTDNDKQKRMKSHLQQQCQWLQFFLTNKNTPFFVFIYK